MKVGKSYKNKQKKKQLNRFTAFTLRCVVQYNNQQLQEMHLEDEEELVQKELQNLRKNQNRSVYFFNLYKKYQNGTVYVDVFKKLTLSQMSSIASQLSVEIAKRKPYAESAQASKEEKSDFFLMSEGCIKYVEKEQKYFSQYRKNQIMVSKLLSKSSNQFHKTLTLLSIKSHKPNDISTTHKLSESSQQQHLSARCLIQQTNFKKVKQDFLSYFSQKVSQAYQSLSQFVITVAVGKKPQEKKSPMSQEKTRDQSDDNSPFLKHE